MQETRLGGVKARTVLHGDVPTAVLDPQDPFTLHYLVHVISITFETLTGCHDKDDSQVNTDKHLSSKQDSHIIRGRVRRDITTDHGRRLLAEVWSRGSGLVNFAKTKSNRTRKGKNGGMTVEKN